MPTSPTPTASVPPALSSEFVRQVTAADLDGSQAPTYATAWAQMLRLGAVCDTPNQTMMVRVHYLNSMMQPASTHIVIFLTQAKPDWNGQYTAVPNIDSWWPLAGAKAITLKVDSCGGGNWQLFGMMS